MKQQKLEEKVRELFERQGFEVSKNGNSFTAEKNGQKLELKAFSSEEYTVEQVEAKDEAKIFVDEQLSSVEDGLDNGVSVLHSEEEDEQYDLPSYEIIGEVAAINQLSEGISRQEAVEGILHHNPQVETILLKQEGLKGEFRLGEYEKLYGEQTETVHKEFGCRYKVDPTKVYFSERFGTERKRVVDQVEDGEKVLVIGAGAGPFAVMAAERAEKVVAVEKNPEAVEYLKENIEMNNVGKTVEPLEADGTDLDLREKFDHIVIPIPEFSYEFLEISFRHLGEGGVIHYYRFLENDDWEQLEQEIEKVAEDLRTEYEIVNRIECGDRSPSETRVCIEIRKK